MKRKSDGTPARNDDDGWKKGALGKFDPPNKLNRNDPWRDPKVLTDGLSDGKGAYTSNENVLTRKVVTPENLMDAGRDIYSDVCKNSREEGGSGPIKYGID